MLLTRIVCGYCSATWLWLVAGLIYPIQVINETTCAVFIVVWLLLPYVLVTAYYWRKLTEKMRSWGWVA